MSVETELRDAAHILRTGHWDGPDRLRGPLAALLDQAADISRGLDRDPYEGLWQGRALAIARAITKETTR
jgi:hypothetical protein